jgi:hypothetical protein
MIIYFRNYQDKLDPNHGCAISSENELISLLDNARSEAPFMAEFCGAGDFHIEIGIGGDFGCVQYSRVDGEPPYLMAVSRQPAMKRGYIESQCGGTPTPVGARNILRFDELREVVLYFMRTGERSSTVSWREVQPGDVKEDAERPLES